jgi:hypothetical protein
MEERHGCYKGVIVDEDSKMIRYEKWGSKYTFGFVTKTELSVNNDDQ